MKWDVTNPDHRMLLETARSWGVSPSAFMNGSQTETEYQYDDFGRLVRSVTKSLDWDEDSVTAALALRAWEDDLCPGCRQPMSETTHPSRMYGYVAEPPIRCHRCTAIEMAQEAIPNTQPQRSSLFVQVKPKETRQNDH